MVPTINARSRKTRKIAAIAVGALVLGLGATYTLASWNDSEWVSGAAGGNPNIGTSTFEVQQNTSNAYADLPENWADRETNPGGVLDFTIAAEAMTPGDSIYAPVALRTVADSVAADVILKTAVAANDVTVNDTDGLLWSAVTQTIYTSTGATPPTACNAASFNDEGWTEMVATTGLNSALAEPFTLAANGNSTQHFCFVLTLPAGSPDTLQGRTIAPAWEFASTSQ